MRVLAGCAVMAAAVARSEDITWINAGGGNWTTASNWSPNQVPGAADHAFITLDGTYTVTVNAAVTVARITLGAAAGTQTLTHNSSGTLTVTGDCRVEANGIFTRTGSTFTCSGALTVAGQVAWMGGTWQGAGTTTLGPSAVATLSGGTGKVLRGDHIWNNSGKIIWAGGGGNSGFLTTRDASAINILAPGILELAADGEFHRIVAGSPGIINQGTVRKTAGGGTTTIGLLTNQQLVEVAVGTLRLGGSVTHTGTHRVGAGATLEFEDSPIFDAASVIEGEGNFRKIAGTAQIKGTFDLGGSNDLGSGSLDFEATSTLRRLGTSVRLNGASSTLTLNSGESVQTQSLLLLNGTITGDDPIHITGPMTWSNGNITGTGDVLAAGGLTFDNTAFGVILDLGGRKLRNAGPAVWKGSVLRLRGTAAMENLAGAVFTIETDNDFDGGQVSNFGTLRKTAGTGLCEIPLVRNEGAVEILSGSLGVSNSFTQTPSGSLTLRIGGPETGTGFSQLTFPDILTAAQGTFEGQLAVRLDEGFTPESGQEFAIIPFPRTPSGGRPSPAFLFDCFDFMKIRDTGLRFVVKPGSTSLNLVAAPAPDPGPWLYQSIKGGQWVVCWGAEFSQARLQTTPALNLPWQEVPDPINAARRGAFAITADPPSFFVRLLTP